MIIANRTYKGGPKDGEESRKDRQIFYAMMDQVISIPNPDHRVASIDHVYRFEKIMGNTAHYYHHSATERTA